MLTSRRSFSSGLTKLELLVLIGVFVVLAGVGFGPVSDYLTNGKVTRAVESARTISTLLSQYATDNDGTYPVGLGTSAMGTSEGIARNLLANNYTPDAALFALGSTARYGGMTPDFSDFTAAHISWDFTGGATTSTGITPAASDLLPTVYCTGESVIFPATPGWALPLSGNGPFGKSGIVVAYKANNAIFIKSTLSGTSAECLGFIPSSFRDRAAYTQIKP